MGHSDSIPHLLHRSFYLVCNPHGAFEHAQHSNEYRIRSFDRYMSLHHGDRSHHGCSFRTAHGVRCCCNAQSPTFPAYEAYIRPARCCRSRHSHNLSFRQSCNSFSRGRSRFSQVLQEISALRPDQPRHGIRNGAYCFHVHARSRQYSGRQRCVRNSHRQPRCNHRQCRKHKADAHANKKNLRHRGIRRGFRF